MSPGNIDLLGDEQPELRALRQSVRRFVDDDVIPHELSLEADGELDAAVWARLVQRARSLGVWALNYPEDAGGQGLDPVAQVVVREEMGRTTMGMSRLARRPPVSLLSAGGYARRVAIDAVREQADISMAITESGAGSSVAAGRTRLERSDAGLRLTGEKHFVTGAPHASHLLVLAKDAGAATDGYTAVLLPAERDGISVHQRAKMGWRGWPWGDVGFDQVCVEDHEIIGRPGEGLGVVMGDIDMTRLGVSAHYIGTAHRAVELAVHQAELRQVSGGRLIDQQTFRWRVAGLSARILTLHQALLGVAAAPAGGRQSRDVRIPALKLLASELAFEAADTALQASGALGYQSDTIENVLFRDARAFRIGEGTSEIQLQTIARSLLGAAA